MKRVLNMYFVLLQGEVALTSPEKIEESAKSTEIDSTDKQDQDEVSKIPLSAVELLKIRQEKIEAKKVIISELVSCILEDPQTNVRLPL